MVGLDTNVLIRILVDDGSPQVAVARRFVVAQAADGEALYVDRIVLVEVVWVLESVFRYEKPHIVVAIDGLLSNTAYVLDERAVVAVALERFRAGIADFADCLITANHAAAGCSLTATFDKRMRALPTTRVLR